MFACLRGRSFDGHDYAAQTIAAGRHRAARRSPIGDRRHRRCRPAGRRGHQAGRRTGLGDRLGRSGRTRHADRDHRDERQDHDRTDRRGPARGDRPTDGDHRDAPRTRGPRRKLPICTHSSRPSVDEGKRAVVMEVSSHALASPSHRRNRLRRRRVHQLRARPPRPPRFARGVLPSQVGVVHVRVRSARRDQHRRHQGTTPRRHDLRPLRRRSDARRDHRSRRRHRRDRGDDRPRLPLERPSGVGSARRRVQRCRTR